MIGVAFSRSALTNDPVSASAPSESTAFIIKGFSCSGSEGSFASASPGRSLREARYPDKRGRVTAIVTVAGRGSVTAIANSTAAMLNEEAIFAAT